MATSIAADEEAKADKKAYARPHTCPNRGF